MKGARPRPEAATGARPTALRAQRLRAVALWGFVPLPFAFYVATCCRTIGLGDSAMLMEAIRGFQLGSHVNTHSLTIVLGKLIALLPIGSEAFRANLTSALIGALTISLLYGVLYWMTSSAAAAAAASSVTAVSHSMWWHSTIVESYALNALFCVAFVGVLASLQRRHTERKLLALFLLSGLALFNHVQMGVLAVGALTYLAAHGLRLPRGHAWRLGRTGLRCLLAFGLGAVPYLTLFVRDAVRHGLDETLWQATGGPFHGIMLQGGLLAGLGDVAYLTALQFPSVYLLAVACGAVLLGRAWGPSPSLLALASVFGVNTWFFMTYNTWDKFAFLLPSFVLLAFVGVFAVQRVVLWVHGNSARTAAAVALFVLSIATPIYLYSRLSVWGREPGLFHARYNNNYTFNTHDCAEFIANPNKAGYRDIETFAERIFELLPEQAILVDSDSRTFYPLRYLQLYGHRRADLRLRLVNSWGFDGWGLTRQDFVELLGRAQATGEELFLVSLAHPFGEILAGEEVGSRYEFEPFALDADRWIYRLTVSANPD